MPSRPETQAHQANDSQLGKLLVKDTTHHVPAWIVCALASGAAVALGYGVHLWMGIAVAVVGCTIGIGGQLLSGRGDHTLMIHEDGVCTEKDGTVLKMRFDEVDSFTVYVHPAKSALLKEFELVSRINPNAPKILSFETLKKSSEFERVCRKLGSRLSDRLEESLNTNGSVNWAGAYTIHQNGIEVPVRSGVFKRVSKISFERINVVELNYSKSQLWIAIDDVETIENVHSPQIKLDMSKPDFFAGLHLFEKLLESSRKREPALAC